MNDYWLDNTCNAIFAFRTYQKVNFTVLQQYSELLLSSADKSINVAIVAMKFQCRCVILSVTPHSRMSLLWQWNSNGTMLSLMYYQFECVIACFYSLNYFQFLVPWWNQRMLWPTDKIGWRFIIFDHITVFVPHVLYFLFQWWVAFLSRFLASVVSLKTIYKSINTPRNVIIND